MKKGLARRQSGFVLLSLVVFLFVAALLALGDMRTLAVQQTLVTSLYAAQNAMAETESALATMEQFAAFEGSELGKPLPAGNARLTTLTNPEPSAANCTNGSEPTAMACMKGSCNSFLYPKQTVAGTGNDNVVGAPLEAQPSKNGLAPERRSAVFARPPPRRAKHGGMRRRAEPTAHGPSSLSTFTQLPQQAMHCRIPQAVFTAPKSSTAWWSIWVGRSAT